VEEHNGELVLAGFDLQDAQNVHGFGRDPWAEDCLDKNGTGLERENSVFDDG
jgi:hypothetical protein